VYASDCVRGGCMKSRCAVAHAHPLQPSIMPPLGDYLYKAMSLGLFTFTVVGGTQAVIMTRRRMKEMELAKKLEVIVICDC
jgi:hypothetical protein